MALLSILERDYLHCTAKKVQKEPAADPPEDTGIERVLFAYIYYQQSISGQVAWEGGATTIATTTYIVIA